MPEFNAEIAAKLVTESIYMKGQEISESASRFIVVLAVPYGKVDSVTTMREAVEGFRELLEADDWEERTFQVYDAQTGEIVDYVPEQEANRCTECGEDCDDGEGYDGLCGNCADSADAEA